MVKTTDWYNLYGESWKGAIVDEAFCHPAKFSRALIRHIYEHAIEEGWLQEGNVVVDPFGGVALGAVDAMHRGLHWRGIELEQKFVDLGNQNIELWNTTIGQHMRRWGSAVLLQGDSRKLGDVIAGACEGVVSSPPYTGSTLSRSDGIDWEKAVTENPANRHQAKGRSASGDYGSSPGQLGSMPEGEIDAALGLKTKGEDIGDRLGFIYCLLWGTENPIAFLLEICVTSDIALLLARLGMPIFTVNLDDGVAFRKIEIAMIPTDLELSDVSNVSSIQKTSKGIFKLTLPCHSITSNRAIDPAPILEAIRLHGKDMPTGRTLALDLRGACDGGTLNRAELCTILEPRFQNFESLATLLTSTNDTRENPGSIGALGRTILVPLFGIGGENFKDFSTMLTSQPCSARSINGDTFPRAASIEPPFNLALFGMKGFSADNTRSIRLCPLEFSIARPGAKVVFVSEDIAGLPCDRNAAKIARDGKLFPHSHTSVINLPSIIAQSEEKCKLDAAISSPPFGAAETRNRSAFQDGEVASMMSRAYTQDRQGTTEGNLGMMDAAISSPPYATDVVRKRDTGKPGFMQGATQGKHAFDEYGETPGQLSTMVEGVISSPPFEASTGSDDPEKRGGLYRDPKRKRDVSLTGTYGETEGQLGAMEGGFEGAISSPPFERTDTKPTVLGAGKPTRATGKSADRNKGDYDYPDSEGQLGQEQAETFWSAARVIVEQVYALIKPGGHAVWVVKAFVRDKEVVDFPGQWQALCEHCGFETLHYHRAWLTEDRGAQYDLFGELHEKQVKRASFFRRLYESKYPENRIDYEVVLCQVKR